jgi:hypothetical protein
VAPVVPAPHADQIRGGVPEELRMHRAFGIQHQSPASCFDVATLAGLCDSRTPSEKADPPSYSSFTVPGSLLA